MDQARDHLGEFGIWRGWHSLSPDLATAIEQAGYGTLWVGSSPDGDLAAVEELLAATSTLVLGTSIVNIWKDDAATVAGSWHRLAGRFPGRFILGIGAGHPEATASYVKPYAALAEYLETLLAAGVPASGVVVAALGPRVLRLAGERVGGAIPYLVTAETPGRPGRSSAPGRCLPRSTRWCWTLIRSGPGRPGGRGSRSPISGWSTTPATCAVLAGRRRTWRAAAATR